MGCQESKIYYLGIRFEWQLGTEELEMKCFCKCCKKNCCYSESWQCWRTDTLVGQQCKDCSNDLGDKIRDVDRVHMDTNGGLKGVQSKNGWNDIMKYMFWNNDFG